MHYTKKEQQALIRIAAESIRNGIKKGKPLSVDLNKMSGHLTEKAASFVTLKKQGELRGCIGTVEASLPLAEDVAQRAWAAAFSDSRFSPVEKTEIDQLKISISILSKPELIDVDSEQALLNEIQPGVDGLILEQGANKGVFLPSVWEQLPEKKDFVRQLGYKAGLFNQAWNSERKIYRFYTDYIHE